VDIKYICVYNVPLKYLIIRYHCRWHK